MSVIEHSRSADDDGRPGYVLSSLRITTAFI